MKFVQRSLVLLLTVCLLAGGVCLFSSCDPAFYQGPDEACARVTVAVRSLPGCYASHGSAHMWALEEDAYGRALFAYHEMSCLDDHLLALCIMQKYESGGIGKSDKVYFLRGKNVVVTAYDEWPTSEEKVKAHFTSEQIAALKTANNWGRETFAADMASAEVNADFSVEGESKIDSNSFFDLAFGSFSHGYPLFATPDGRLVYTVESKERLKDGTYEERGVYLVLLSADKRLDKTAKDNMLKLTGVEHFTEEFARFMIQNGLAEEGDFDPPENGSNITEMKMP